MRTLRPALLLVLLASCGPPGPDIAAANINEFLVYDWNAESQEYELIVSEIETLTDPQTIQGDVAELRGGGALNVSTSAPEGREDVLDAITVSADKTPSAEYFIDQGVAVPFDTDSQLMVTLYHHIERADQYFMGLDVDPVGKLKTYYFPQFAIFGIQLPLLTDNAAYAVTLDAFLIPPTVFLTEGVPLSANRGVMVHEYSHAVFNRLVFDNDRAPRPIWDETFDETARNELRSLDEGVADIFGALATGDSDFIGPSISQEAFGLDRDLDKERVWNAALQEEIDETDTGAGTNPYILGSVVASAVWATRDFLSDEEVALTTVAALRAIAVPDDSFRLSDFVNAWLDELDPDDRDAACEIFVERLERDADELVCGL